MGPAMIFTKGLILQVDIHYATFHIAILTLILKFHRIFDESDADNEPETAVDADQTYKEATAEREDPSENVDGHGSLPDVSDSGDQPEWLLRNEAILEHNHQTIEVPF